MSTRHKDHESYWNDVYPRLAQHLATETKQEIKDIIFTCNAFYGFLTEDVGQKVREHKNIHPRLDLFLVFAFDQLRAALVLYENLNLSPLAISARASFENLASIKFITSNADPAKFASLYERYKDIVRLKAHSLSDNLGPIPQAEIERIKQVCPEWFKSDGTLKKKPHWTAIDGMSFEQLVEKIKMEEYYSLYRTTSNFVHASPITQNMYKGPKGLGAISDERRARQFALLICLFTLDTLKEYVVFFGVEFDQNYFLGLIKKVSELAHNN